MPRSRATWVAGLPAAMSQKVLRIGESVKVGRRPPRSLPAAWRAATESVSLSRVISSSICARAVITVQTIEPIGVEVSTSLLPRFSTCNPAPLLRRASAKSSMFCVDRPASRLE